MLASSSNKKDSALARCIGLLGCGPALKVANSQKIDPSIARKGDGPFYCPDCYSDVIIRKCSDKRDHFAHHARMLPVITASKNHELHNKCRDEICGFLQEKFPEENWAIERTIPPRKGKNELELRPDISGRINGKPVAIEIQKTSYTIPKIHDRTLAFTTRGIFVLWVVPLSESIGEDPFRPRLYEKYLHCMYHGRVYYWTPESSPSLNAVHYSPVQRYIPQSTWYDVNTETERTEGGYYVLYRTLKQANPCTNLDLSSNFEVREITEFIPKNGRMKIPKCNILKDKMVRWWDPEERTKLLRELNFYSESNDDDYEYEEGTV